MKHFKTHALAILPLLSSLSMSPVQLEAKFVGRDIASVEDQSASELTSELVQEAAQKASQEINKQVKADILEASKIKVSPVVKEHPKLDELTSKVKPESLIKDPELDADKLKVKSEELKVSLDKTKEELKKDSSDETQVKDQRQQIEDQVVDLLLVEGGLKELSEAEKIEAEDKEKTEQSIAEAKDILEALLTDMDSKEEVKDEKEAEKESVVIAEEKVEEKKDEVKVEEKKDEKPVVAEAEEEKEEKEEKEEEKVACEHNSEVTTPSLEQLISQQNQIMQQMMSMMTMQSMMQQQMMMQLNQLHQRNASTVYEYADQTNSGNWVYYPRGFQPQQNNIFAPQVSGYYPDNANQSNWQLAPQMSLLPHPMPQNGTFGANVPAGSLFNLENVTQAQLAVPNTPVIQQPILPVQQPAAAAPVVQQPVAAAKPLAG